VRKLEGFFDVSYDSSRKLIKITTYGFWNLQVVEQFAQAIADISRVADDGCDTLLNTCRTEIHTLEVSEALGRISYPNRDANSGRIAIVSPSMLLRMQTKRIQPPDGNFGYFDTEQEALQWLAAA
jgi:hypothetical protein